MSRTLGRIVLFGFSLLITGQALAEYCGNVPAGGRACCTYENRIQAYPALTAEGYIAGGPGLAMPGLFNDGITAGGSPEYSTATKDACISQGISQNRYFASSSGCYRHYSHEVTDITQPFYWNAPRGGGVQQTWTTTVYSLTKELLPNNPSRPSPCFRSNGQVRWIPGAPVGPITPVVCPINDLEPKPTDACSLELEARFGSVATPTACPIPAMNVMNDPAGEPCFLSKLAKLGVDYKAPTSTYRTIAYQKHLADLWGKYVWHAVSRTPEILNACAVRRETVNAEQFGPPAPGHRLGFKPSGNSHSGDAFDVDGGVVDNLINAVPSVQAYLDTATTGSPACKLDWGGSFGDKYHFKLRK